MHCVNYIEQKDCTARFAACRGYERFPKKNLIPLHRRDCTLGGPLYVVYILTLWEQQTKKLDKLTEENCEILDILDHGLQHGARDQLDVGLHLKTPWVRSIEQG